MAKHKHIDLICIAAAVLALVLCVALLFGESLGLRSAERTMGYEDRLFDTTQVHTIDIVIDDWESFLSTAQSEEYSLCDVVIDGETVSGVGIRGKGNTSLSNVASMNSQRYSFKVEFDHYSDSGSYHGLDKLSLNNLIQDNTYMKDYLTYRMMGEFGAAAPLCSFVYLTVNGEDWGLYLAVEGVEESFLQRNYGSDYGELYKPDSLNMGGGRGNGRDFNMDDFMARQDSGEAESAQPQMQMPQGEGGNRNHAPNGDRGGFGGFGGFSLDEETVRAAFEDLGLDTSVLDGIDFSNITMEQAMAVLSSLDEDTMQQLMESVMSGGFGGDMQMPDMGGGFGGGGMPNMGGSGTTLQYVDDNIDSYATIFDSAKTDITDSDKMRLIAALKSLSEGDTSAVDSEALLRYFVVHNFVVNGDSYTGSMVHNYYLYEEDGQLSMIPWDYNLAFGTFQSGSAASAVNDDIDAPLSVSGDGSRPMADWIFQSQEMTALYHEYFAQFLDTVDITALIDEAYALIAPYVEKDPTAFCTYAEFESGVAALRQFCTLRTESIRLQLAGDDTAVDTGELDLSDMGTMGMGGGFGGGEMPDMGEFTPDEGSIFPSLDDETASVLPEMGQMPDMGQMPNAEQMPDFSGGMPQMPTT